jgi:glutamine synthetase type III
MEDLVSSTKLVIAGVTLLMIRAWVPKAMMNRTSSSLMTNNSFEIRKVTASKSVRIEELNIKGGRSQFSLRLFV